jgi:hypothetical protein
MQATIRDYLKIGLLAGILVVQCLTFLQLKTAPSLLDVRIVGQSGPLDVGLVEVARGSGFTGTGTILNSGGPIEVCVATFQRAPTGLGGIWAC